MSMYGLYDFEEYFSGMFWNEMRRLSRVCKKPYVVHGAECPVCGRKGVNLYRRDKTLKCRKCWEADGITNPKGE